jgi:hypothetical protein
MDVISKEIKERLVQINDKMNEEGTMSRLLSERMRNMIEKCVKWEQCVNRSRMIQRK